MATSKTTRYIRYNTNLASLHNGSSGVNSDGDGPSTFQEPTFQPYDRRTLGSGTTWDIPSQKVTLSNTNPDSQTFVVRFTNDATLGIGDPHYGGLTPTSMLIPYRGINTVAAYAQTVVYYLRTFTENHTGAPFTFNIEVKAGPGNWNGTPTNVNPETFNYTQINSSGNVFRGEKIIPRGRGTLWHSSSDFDFSTGFNPSGVSNIATFDHYGTPGLGFSDWIPTYDSGNAVTDGTSTVEVKITTTWAGSGSVTFYANPVQEYDHLQSTRSTVLFYQGSDIIMDGSDADHSIPAMSTTSSLVAVGNQNHIIDPVNYHSSVTLTEESINVKLCPDVDLDIASTLTATASHKLGFDLDLKITSALDATTENFVRADPVALSTTATLEVDPSFKVSATEDLSIDASVSTFAGLIYDITGDYTWDSFNLNSYFVQGYAVADFSLNQGEYSWTFLATSTWDAWPTTTWIGDEATWDNWPDDVWETPYIIGTAGSLITTASFKLGDVVTYTGSFTVDEDSAFEKTAQADLTAQFTTEFTAVGIIDVDIAMSGAFAPALTANIIYDLEQEPIRITGAFTPVLTANAITDTFADIDVAFTFAVEPTFRPGTTAELYQAQSEVEINPTFRPSGIAALLAFASTLQVGRLFFQADPYFTIQVLQESRQVVLPFENRQTLVSQETRLNTIGTETGDYLVPQETRSLRLRIPPFKNRFSTPRVRQEQ